MKNKGSCLLWIPLSEAAFLLAFLLGASLEEVLAGVLVLLACSLFHVWMLSERGSRK